MKIPTHSQVPSVALPSAVQSRDQFAAERPVERGHASSEAQQRQDKAEISAEALMLLHAEEAATPLGGAASAEAGAAQSRSNATTSADEDLGGTEQSARSDAELTSEEQSEVSKLQARDREVRA